jgi:hypothetical protein
VNKGTARGRRNARRPEKGQSFALRPPTAKRTARLSESQTMEATRATALNALDGASEAVFGDGLERTTGRRPMTPN